MARFWNKPLFGVQCMQGLPRGYAAVVEDFGSVAEASVRSPFKPTISQSFDDADSARSWAEQRAALVCLNELRLTLAPSCFGRIAGAYPERRMRPRRACTE